jgi:hypothetical protein
MGWEVEEGLGEALSENSSEWTFVDWEMGASVHVRTLREFLLLLPQLNAWGSGLWCHFDDRPVRNKVKLLARR